MISLLNNSEVLQKVAVEIDEHVGNERLIEESDMAHLPHLQCILRRVLRLYPGGPLLVPYESREEVKIGGYNIPRGMMILVKAYQIHRDPDT
jgi:indol-3-yl-methylglucosinolate hydroxylase